jgi:AcrR family transcriptional regulator
MTHDTTREKLMDAAESLFAEKGYDAVSIRDIAKAAEANVSAINYHFQGKEKFYQCVLERRLVPKRDKILQALDRLQDEGREPPDLGQVVETFVRAHLVDALINPSGETGLRLIARELNEPRFGAKVVFQELIIPVKARIQVLLKELLPGLGDDRILWILISIVSQIVNYTMRWRNIVQRPDLPGNDLETLFGFADEGLQVDQYMEMVIEHITRFSTGGIMALYREDGFEV